MSMTHEEKVAVFRRIELEIENEARKEAGNG